MMTPMWKYKMLGWWFAPLGTTAPCWIQRDRAWIPSRVDSGYGAYGQVTYFETDVGFQLAKLLSNDPITAWKWNRDAQKWEDL